MTLIEKTSIAVTWLAISIIGATFVFWHWSAQGQSERAAANAGLFVAIITGVFTVGTLYYAGQHIDCEKPRAANSYFAALKTSLIQQGILLTLSALALDLGQALHICVVAVAGYWPMVVIIVLRRPYSPKPSDLRAIRYGFLVVYALVAILGSIVWRRLGRF
jgi:hypothetical protein